MPVAVSDASVLIHLSLIERLDLLHAFYERVLIPAAVWREVVDEGKGRAGAQAVQQAVEAGGIEVMSVPDECLARVLKRTLDEGEAEALALALALEAGDVHLLIDESHARRVAESYDVDYTGVLGLLMRAKADGLIPSLRVELDRLRTEGTFWISDALYEDALKEMGEA